MRTSVSILSQEVQMPVDPSIVILMSVHVPRNIHRTPPTSLPPGALLVDLNIEGRQGKLLPKLANSSVALSDLG